jgi:hypothetical protein
MKQDTLTLDIFGNWPAAEQAKARRDDGIHRAVSHADQVTPGWSDQAFQISAMYLSGLNAGSETTSEAIRLHAERAGLSDPPDTRAWGAVLLRLAKANKIKKLGWTTAQDPKAHCRPITLWQIK